MNWFKEQTRKDRRSVLSLLYKEITRLLKSENPNCALFAGFINNLEKEHEELLRKELEESKKKKT